MLELSLAEMLFIGVIAVIVIGPKDLPKVFSHGMKLFRQLQGMVTEVRQSMDEMVKESGVDDIRKDVKYLVDQHGEMQEIYDISEELEAIGKESPKKLSKEEVRSDE